MLVVPPCLVQTLSVLAWEKSAGFQVLSVLALEMSAVIQALTLLGLQMEVRRIDALQSGRAARSICSLQMDRLALLVVPGHFDIMLGAQVSMQEGESDH